MKNCPSCAEEVQDAATVCPHCKTPIYTTDPKANSIVRVIMSLLVFYILYKGISWFVHSEADREMDRITQSVSKYK